MSIFKKLPFEWQVGLRYTRAGRRSSKNSFISFISLIAVGSIALGVAALIIVLSVMNGFQKEVLERMVAVLSHIEVTDATGAMNDWQAVAKEAFQNKAVIGAAPYTQSQALLLKDGVVHPTIIRGVLPEEEPKVSDIGSQVVAGKFADLRPGEFNIVLGIEIARALQAQIGDKVRLIAIQDDVTVAGVIPRSKPFTVVGIFDAGEYEYNSSLAVINIDDSEKMFHLDAPMGLRLKVIDRNNAPLIARELARTMSGNLLLRDWSQQNRTWFAAVQTEKKMMFLVLLIISMVATFNLISTLVMTVTDKQADIAILRTLGASPSSIMKIFMIQGSVIGLLGTAIGVGLGVLVALNIDVIVPFIEHLFGVKFISSDVYLISELPSDLQWSDVSIIGAVSMAMAFFATLYPSWAAARVRPAEALRYE